MKSAQILIAGETQTSNSMRQLVLEAAGYIVATATDVFSALEAARRATFQLAVVDGSLPFASAQHLLRTFRSRGIPTLLLAPREISEPLLSLASVALPFDDAYTLPRIVESLLLNHAGTAVPVPLGIGQETANVGDHIAWLYTKDTDCEKAIRFFGAGLQQDETSIALGTGPQKERLGQLLEIQGFHPQKLMDSGRLHWIDVANRVELGEAWVDEVRKIVTSRSSPIRVLASVALGRKAPSESELLRFEAQLDAVLRNTRSIAVCLYDLNHLSAKQLLLAGLGQHSILVTPDGVAREHLSLGTVLLSS